MSLSSGIFEPALRLKTLLQPTVWHRITPLSQEYKCINLGQGFPGFSPPEFVRKNMSNVVLQNESYNYLCNQYARSQGEMRLINTLANRYKYLNQPINPLTNIVVGNGATGVIYNIMHAILNKDDEVVVFEPSFDIYTAQAEMCGAKVVPVSMYIDSATNTWKFDAKTLASRITTKTRLLILNTPHNPTGKVYTKEELLEICAVVAKYPNLVILSDEVYEHMIYDKQTTPHISIASITKEEYAHLVPSADVTPVDMWNKVLTVSSAGKTLACTGWKIGWAVGHEKLISLVSVVQAWVSFSVNTPSQVAVSQSYEDLNTTQTEYLSTMVADYQTRLNKLTTVFEKYKIPYVRPDGSFFVVIDVSKVKIPETYLAEEESRDWAFSMWAIKEGGVATIPCSVFYSPETRQQGVNYVRVAFAQANEVMDEAVTRLSKLFEH